jgi:hypothetical protein
MHIVLPGAFCRILSCLFDMSYCTLHEQPLALVAIRGRCCRAFECLVVLACLDHRASLEQLSEAIGLQLSALVTELSGGCCAIMRSRCPSWSPPTPRWVSVSLVSLDLYATLAKLYVRKTLVN